MSNMVPQAPDNNQGAWANFENFLRTLLPANEVYIVAGQQVLSVALATMDQQQPSRMVM